MDKRLLAVLLAVVVVSSWLIAYLVLKTRAKIPVFSIGNAAKCEIKSEVSLVDLRTGKEYYIPEGQLSLYVGSIPWEDLGVRMKVSVKYTISGSTTYVKDIKIEILEFYVEVGGTKVYDIKSKHGLSVWKPASISSSGEIGPHTFTIPAKSIWGSTPSTGEQKCIIKLKVRGCITYTTPRGETKTDYSDVVYHTKTITINVYSYTPPSITINNVSIETSTTTVGTYNILQILSLGGWVDRVVSGG